MADPKITVINMIPPVVEGGNPAVGFVEIDQLAPPGGVTVTTWSDDPTLMTIPPSVVIPAATNFAQFPVTTSTVSQRTVVFFYAELGLGSMGLGVHIIPPQPPVVKCHPPTLPPAVECCPLPPVPAFPIPRNRKLASTLWT